MALIDGSFKANFHKSHYDINHDGTKEVQIILTSEQTIISVYVSNYIGDSPSNLRFGESIILVGNDST